jgi:hypothetical protein
MSSEPEPSIKTTRNRSSTPLRARALLIPGGLLVAALIWTRLTTDQQSPTVHGGFRDVLPESGIDFKAEEHIAEQFEINLYDHGSGVAIADFDGDGDDDVLFLNQLGENALYRNLGGDRFENVTAQAGPLALADRVCVGAAFADYDNDGDQDLYVTSTRGGNVLLENRGRGRYRDVTRSAGVELIAHSQTASFFDYDNDGYLDLFVTNTARWTLDQYDKLWSYYPASSDLWEHVFNVADRELNVLYRNNHDGTFSDVTGEAGLAGKGWSGDVATFDFDDDGNLDLLVTNMFGTSQLYRNDGGGHFDDVTADVLGKTSLGAIGCQVFDFNNDGRLDLFITDMHSDMWVGFDDQQLVQPGKKFQSIAGPAKGPQTEQRRYMLSLERRFRDELGLDFNSVLLGNSLFRNEGAGRFSEVSDAAGMETFWPWGVAAGDFDNDGNEDVFIAAGMGQPFFYWPNSLMLNVGDGTFVDRAAESGVEPPREGAFLGGKTGGRAAPRSSRCAAAADFDGDGRLDLMVNNFDDRPYYFKNEFPQRHYVAFRLQGVRSNRDAIGAVVKIYRGGRVQVRQVQCSGGYLSQSSKTLHFGLGDDNAVDRVEIRWPSGTRQTIESPSIDRVTDVREPE